MVRRQRPSFVLNLRNLCNLWMDLFAARIDPKESADNQQHQRLHEDKEPPNKRSIFIERIRERHPGTENQSTHYPNQLPLTIPHVGLVLFKHS
jgi:hypothetical protein